MQKSVNKTALPCEKFLIARKHRGSERGVRTCQGKISLTSVLPEEMWAQFRADIPEGGSPERRSRQIDETNHRPILGPPLGAYGQGRQTTVAICDTGPNDKVEDKTTLNRGTGERAQFCAG